jgi:hypothetical protein
MSKSSDEQDCWISKMSGFVSVVTSVAGRLSYIG